MMFIRMSSTPKYNEVAFSTEDADCSNMQFPVFLPNFSPFGRQENGMGTSFPQ